MTRFLQFPLWPLRSALAGWLVAILALAAGVPLFLRMPPWCDLTLYDVAARTVIRGGVLYRDVFDTNLPGFVWCLIGVRRLFGNSVEAVRAVDLVVVAAIAFVMMRYLRRSGADSASRAWFAAAVALFYPFTTEFSHAQRDIWMTLPMLVAVSLRVSGLETNPLSRRALFWHSLLEGAVWGLAIWIKPHVLLVAIVLWLTTLRARWRTPLPKAVRTDFLGYLVGGAAIGLAGISLLAATGTWKYLVEVFTKWNTNYLLAVWSETFTMLGRFSVMFPLWSRLHLAGVPLAIRAIWRMGGDPLKLRRGVIAAFYLVMLAQSCCLQRNFDYVHIPEMFLLFAVLALELPPLLPVACLVIGVWMACYPREFDIPIRLWPNCFLELDPLHRRELKRWLSREPVYYSSIDPVEIGEVADWLKSQGVQEGDVIAFHDSPHAVYLELGHKPPFRFMHITTSLLSPGGEWRMRRELEKALAKAKYVISDLHYAGRFNDTDLWRHFSEAGPDLLPPDLSPRMRKSFPYDQPAVFRSGGGHGRYIVHRIDKPLSRFEWDLSGMKVEPIKD